MNNEEVEYEDDVRKRCKMSNDRKCPKCNNDSLKLIFGEIEGGKSYVKCCGWCGLVIVSIDRKDFSKDDLAKHERATRIQRFYGDKCTNLIGGVIIGEPLTTMEREFAEQILKRIALATDEEVLDDNAYSEEEINASIRAAGGDPEAIGERGLAEVKAILERHKKFMSGDESNTVESSEVKEKTAGDEVVLTIEKIKYLLDKGIDVLSVVNEYQRSKLQDSVVGSGCNTVEEK